MNVCDTPAKTNLESAVGRALDNGGNGEGGLLTTIERFKVRLTQSMAELPDPVIAGGAGAAWLGGKAATVGGTAALKGTALGVSNGIITGAFTAGAAALTAAVLALPTALTAAAAGALTVTYDQAKKIAQKDGAQAFIGKADTGEAPALNPMEGLKPKDPIVQKYLRTRFRGVFGNWEGSLPPGTAGMPAPAPVRLPGLDGRPKAPAVEAKAAGFGADAPKIPPMVMGRPKAAEDRTVARRGSLPSGEAGMPAPAPVSLPGLDGRVGPRPSEAPKPDTVVRQPGFGDATPKIPPMTMQRPASPVPVSAETIAPKVETGAIENLHTRADELKEALQAAGGVTVAPQASPAGLSGTLAVAKELLATLQAIPGAISASNGALFRATAGGGLQGRSRSFSDGVTPGAGAQ